MGRVVTGTPNQMANDYSSRLPANTVQNTTPAASTPQMGLITANSPTVQPSQSPSSSNQMANNTMNPSAFPAGALNNRISYTAGQPVITLAAIGTGVDVKMSSGDDIVESLQGSLGTQKFSVAQLPDRATLALGGGTLLGIDVLRKALLVYAIYAEYIQYEAGSTGQLDNPLRVTTGSVFAGINTDTTTPSVYKNNMQQSQTLVDLRRPGGFIVASNTAFILKVNDTVSVQLSLRNCAIVPYNMPF